MENTIMAVAFDRARLTDLCAWSLTALPHPLHIEYKQGKLSAWVDKGDELGELVFEKEIISESGGPLSAQDLIKHTADIIDWSRVL